jgi:GMP reductase
MPGLAYSNVYLSPNYSELSSRSLARTNVNFLGREWKAPWIPANMETVINVDIAKQLSEEGFFYIYHRFKDGTYDFVKQAQGWKTISISIGVKETDKELLLRLAGEKQRIDFITIDVAHGHCRGVKEMLAFLRVVYPNAKYIAGNVCTPQAIKDLVLWGAHAAKVGIAGGQACSTKNMTGFHIPMFTCVQETAEEARYIGETGEPTIPIIADGGVRENGDIAKALVAGATMVMAGSIFAACIDAPGENIYDSESADFSKITTDYFSRPFPHKIIAKGYHGSASEKQKGEKKHVEGFEIEIPCNGLTYSEKYKEMVESLQSAISYAGGEDLSAFKTVEYITV